MHNKYRIGFITFTIVAILAISFAYYFSSKSMINQSTNSTSTSSDNSKTVPTDGPVTKKNCYYLMKLNDYVVVYESDKKTIFEYTDIIYEDLPALLKQEIQNGNIYGKP